MRILRAREIRLGKSNGASLIELLVVIFIMGIMMSLLLPALQRARLKAEESVCENNLYQLKFGLQHFLEVNRKFPAPNYWTVDILPYIEQRPLADTMKSGFAPDAVLPRPPVMQCRLQTDFDSRVETVGVCHFVLTVDRNEDGLALVEKGWNLGDRQLLDDTVPEEPWYVSPEMTHTAQEEMFTNEVGPHPEGSFDTVQGYFP